MSCPGATETEFAGHAGNANSLLFRLGAADSMTVAREGLQIRLVADRWQSE